MPSTGSKVSVPSTRPPGAISCSDADTSIASPITSPSAPTNVTSLSESVSTFGPVAATPHEEAPGRNAAERIEDDPYAGALVREIQRRRRRRSPARRTGRSRSPATLPARWPRTGQDRRAAPRTPTVRPPEAERRRRPGRRGATSSTCPSAPDHRRRADPAHRGRRGDLAREGSVRHAEPVSEAAHERRGCELFEVVASQHRGPVGVDEPHGRVAHLRLEQCRRAAELGRRCRAGRSLGPGRAAGAHQSHRREHRRSCVASSFGSLRRGYPRPWRSRPGGRGRSRSLEESPDSEGQGAGESQAGATSRTGQQRADRRARHIARGKGETVR